VLRALLITAACCISVSSSFAATWPKVFQFTGNGYVSSAYFFNRNEGLVGLNGATSGSPIYRTTDGGQTWTPVSTPAATGVWMSEIWFSDATHGWATCFNGTTTSNLWRTSDRGLTWSVTSFIGSASSIRETPSAIIVAVYAGNGIRVSMDQGATFSIMSSEGHDGLDFVDGLHGVGTGFLSHFVVTSDGGATWNLIATPSNEAWGVYGYKGSARFLAVPEDISGGGTSKVYITTDYGSSWQQSTTMPGKMTGSVQGSGTVAYVQSALSTSSSGLFRTTDYGATWTSVGGPNNQFDSRFAVTECGHVVFAFDNLGGVYRSVDVADDLPSVPCGFRRDTLRTLSTLLCDSLRRLQFIHTPLTDTEQLIALYIVDSTRSPYASGSVVLDSMPLLPLRVSPSDSVGFRVAWRPHGYLNRAASDSVIVRAIFQSRNGLDTMSMAMHLIANLSPAQYALSAKTIRVDQVEHCVPRDTGIVLTNQGCDTLWLTSVQFGSNSDWSLLDDTGQPVTFPVGVMPGNTMRFILRVRPVRSKSITESLKFLLRYFDRDSSASVQLSESGKVTDALALLSRVSFDSLPTCVTLDSVVWLPNASCDTIYITSASINSNDWQLYDTSGTALRLPVAIPPGGKMPVLLRFGPTKIGSVSSIMTVRFKYLGFDSLHTISLSGAGKQAGTLDHTAALDFGDVSYCSVWDSVLSFSNATCDPIVIDSVQVVAPFVLLDSVQLPATIAAGRSLQLRVRYLPSTRGLATTKAVVKYFVGGRTRYDTISVAAAALPGSSVYTQSLGTDSIRFNDRTECDRSDAISCTIGNGGCDSLWITAVSIDDTTGVLRVTASEALPKGLRGGDTLRLILRLDSLAPGAHDARVRVTLRHADGSVSDTIIYLHASIARGDRTLALDTNTIDLGSRTVCALHDTTIVYTNTGCMPVSVLNWRMTDFSHGFNVTGNGVAPPIRLLPGESDTLRVYAPKTAGVFTDTIIVGCDADGSQLRRIPVTVNILPVDSLGFTVTVDNSTPKVGDIVSVRIYPSAAVSGKGVRRVDAQIEYHADAMSAGVAESPFAVTLGPATRSGRHVTQPLTISDPTEIAFDPNVPVVTLHYKILLTDTTDWRFTFRDVQLNSLDANFAKCTLAAVGNELAMRLDPRCGDDLIIAQLQGKPLLSVAQVVPDPIDRGQESKARLTITSSLQGEVAIRVFNSVGELVLTKAVSVRALSPEIVLLDCRGLRSGAYRYSVDFIGAENTASTTGVFQVIR
jgi:photosystem II stability/assembly factor-like uncharacterized protein